MKATSEQFLGDLLAQALAEELVQDLMHKLNPKTPNYWLLRTALAQTKSEAEKGNKRAEEVLSTASVKSENLQARLGRMLAEKFSELICDTVPDEHFQHVIDNFFKVKENPRHL
jgi:hypothetical protein